MRLQVFEYEQVAFCQVPVECCLQIFPFQFERAARHAQQFADRFALDQTGYLSRVVGSCTHP